MRRREVIAAALGAACLAAAGRAGARPGGNLTGFLQSPELLWGKRLDLLREVMGHPPRRLGFVGNPGNTSFAAQWRNAQEETARIGAEIKRADVGAAGEIDGAFRALADRDAILVQWDCWSGSAGGSRSSPPKTDCRRSMSNGCRSSSAGSCPTAPS